MLLDKCELEVAKHAVVIRLQRLLAHRHHPEVRKELVRLLRVRGPDFAYDTPTPLKPGDLKHAYSTNKFVWDRVNDWRGEQEYLVKMAEKKKRLMYGEEQE